MVKKLILPSSFFTLLCISAFLFSCGNSVHEEGNGTITEETRNVGAFFSLDIEGTYEIVLQEGSTPLVTVETDENLHQYIETKMDGKVLKIRNVEEVGPSEGVRLIITYQNLEDVFLGGAVKLHNRGVLNSENLHLRVKGAGMVDLNIQSKELSLEVPGSGAINLRGKADKQDLSLSGAGNLAAFELESKDCEINLTGVGSAQVFVTNNLQAEISGVGSIRFKGDPQNISREVSGLGIIERQE